MAPAYEFNISSNLCQKYFTESISTVIHWQDSVDDCWQPMALKIAKHAGLLSNNIRLPCGIFGGYLYHNVVKAIEPHIHQTALPIVINEIRNNTERNTSLILFTKLLYPKTKLVTR